MQPHYVHMRNCLKALDRRAPAPLGCLLRAWDETVLRGHTLNWGNYESPLFKATINLFLHIMKKADKKEVLEGMMEFNEELSFALDWELHGRRFITCSEGLAFGLSQTECTFKLKDVRAPFPLIYIEFPKNLFNLAKIDLKRGSYHLVSAVGAYVYERFSITADKSAAVFKLSAVIEDNSEPLPEDKMFLQTAAFELTPEQQEKTIETHLQEADLASNNDPYVPFLQREGKLIDAFELARTMYRYCFNVLLYMSNPDYDVKAKPTGLFAKTPFDPENKGLLRRMLASADSMQTVVIGQNIEISENEKQIALAEAADPQLRNTPRPHWRRGHWRGVWHGAGEAKRLVPAWIRATLVNRDLVAKGSEKEGFSVYKVTE